ncbi:cation:proton antiporter [uncultured Bifidobacterium sp.]|uniref:cation:proton antiporter n=1 Tax=uncultured Bifidobacterium sp. TaxID=165187 RepID=UPI002616A357|nr:cation:proton antiporter [uncultured Bifidobacterium sp.]
MTQDLISLTVIMAVSVVCPIVSRLIPRQAVPQTVLLLVAGAALGPYGLGVIHLTKAVDLISELGLGFLFLIAGYEIEPSRLGGHQGRMGLATWLVTFGLAWGLVILLPFFTTHDMNGAAAAICLTTTALGTLMPILKERSLEGTPVGDAVVAYGTWGELCPIVAMAALLSARTQWQTFLVLAAFCLICAVVAVVPVAARRTGGWLYRFVVDTSDTSSQTLMRITVLLLLALVTCSAIFGLDLVLGAFASGFVLRMILPDGSDSLDVKLDGVAYGFLIPVFFVASGAVIDVHAVASDPTLFVVFILMLLLVRSLPVFLAMAADRRNPMSSHNRATVALYCATALPLIVAVTSVAVSSGAMRRATASTLVAAGAVTVLVMPLLALMTSRVADAHPVGAVREIAHSPREARAILAEHWDLFELMRTLDRLEAQHSDIRDEIHRSLHGDMGVITDTVRERRRKAVERALRDHRRLQEELSRRRQSLNVDNQDGEGDAGEDV